MSSIVTEILPSTDDSLDLAADLLLDGQIVAVPTETVYGLAGLANRNDSLQQIFKVKGRPEINPLIIHVDLRYKTIYDLDAAGIINSSLLSQQAKEVSEELLKLFWPGPLTLIFPKGPKISLVATAQGPTVAIRQSSHAVFQRLLAKISIPLAAPSANQSNRISPTSAQDVMDELYGKIKIILDGGLCTVGVESTILQVLPSGEIKELRPGGLAGDLLLNKGFKFHSSRKISPHEPIYIISPGQLPVHYSPNKPLLMIQPEILEFDDLINYLKLKVDIKTDSTLKIAIIRYQSRWTPIWQKLLTHYSHWSWYPFDVSLRDNATRTAAELFSLMRKADQSPADIILIESPPQEGTDLWPAVKDRLKRASK